jgi:hypothetical protein
VPFVQLGHGQLQFERRCDGMLGRGVIVDRCTEEDQ